MQRRVEEYAFLPDCIVWKANYACLDQTASAWDLASLEVLHLRNRFLLTVICCPIYRWLEVSRKVDISQARTDSRQPVIYWATNYLLARLYFGSYTGNDVTENVSFRSFQFSAVKWKEIPPRISTVIMSFISIYFTICWFKKTTLHRLT